MDISEKIIDLYKQVIDTLIEDKDLNVDSSIEEIIIIEHNKNINERLQSDKDINFCSMLSFDYNKTESKTDNIPIKLSLTFCTYDELKKSYPIAMPQKCNLLYCPKNINLKTICFWDSKKNNFINKNNKIIEPINIIKNLLQEHLKPSKVILGSIERFKRYLKWTVFFYIFKCLSKITRIIFYLFSGSTIIIKKEIGFEYYLMNIDKEITISLNKKLHNKIELNGFKLNLISAVSYSAIHFILFLILFYTNLYPKILIIIFKVPFLTVTYTIISLTIFTIILPKIFYILTESNFNIIRQLTNGMIRQYDNKKLKYLLNT